MSEGRRRECRRRAVAVLGAACVAGAVWPVAAGADLVFLEAVFDDDAGGTADGLDGASAVAISPDGRHVYVAALAEDEVAIFARSATTGRLRYLGRAANGEQGVSGLDGPYAPAVTPDGLHLYVAALTSSSVAVFARDATTGQLDFVQAQLDGVGGVDGLLIASDLAISADGEHVYVTGAGEDKVAVFDRNPVTGALAFVEAEQNGLGGVTLLESPLGVAVAPDGENVYVAANQGDALVVFARNGASGALLFVEAVDESEPPVDGLTAPIFPTVSPDGEHVYVVGSEDDAIGVFARSGDFGEVEFVQAVNDGDEVPAGFDSVAAIALTPDGGSAYVTSSIGDAVVELAREPATGELTYLRAAFDGAGGVEGLEQPSRLVVSPDGKHLYVAGTVDDAVVAFALLPLAFAADFETGDLSEWSANVP